MPKNFPKIALLLSLIFFIFSCVAFLFLYKTVNKNNEESRLREQEWHSEALRRDEIRTLDNSVKIIESERTKLETHFAKSSDVVSFLDTIESLAPQTGAKAEVTSADISQDYTTLLVGLKASGTFSSLYKFLTLLENAPYELEFVGVEMHKEGGTEVVGKDVKLPKWNMVFKIKLLSFVP